MRRIVLLRGINLGSRNRIAMPALREALADAGFDDVGTYLQSGNVVLTSGASAKRLAEHFERLISDSFGLDVSVIVRTRDELAKVVKRNPLADVADNPKRYQVTFLSAELGREEVEKLAGLAAPSERVTAIDREVYAWHPDGVARSKLWSRLASQSLGVSATSRNWTSVVKLLEMANG